MKRILFLSTMSLFVAGLAGNAPLALADQPDYKVVICHVPPGNPDHAFSIVIDYHAVTAHLDHGDYLGGCDVLTTPQ